MDNIKVKDIFKKYTMIIALILVILFFQIGTGGKILFAQNINNLISQNAYVFVLATGMLCCILTGGNIDLSVGSVVCFTGGIGAAMMAAGSNMIVAVVVMLVVGLLVGMFQGFWIAYIKVPPFIATLAGMYAFRGLSNVVLQGFAVSVTDTAFLNIFGGGADCYVPDFIGSGELNVTWYRGGGSLYSADCERPDLQKGEGVRGGAPHRRSDKNCSDQWDCHLAVL